MEGLRKNSLGTDSVGSKDETVTHFRETARQGTLKLSEADVNPYFGVGPGKKDSFKFENTSGKSTLPLSIIKAET